MNLAAAFAESVERQPRKIALFWGEREYSYAELWRQSGHIARQLQQKLGVKPGDRVGLWLKNCPEFVPSLFGILRAGAVVVPINNFLKADEVNYILSDAEIDALITDDELGTHHRALEEARPGLRLFRVDQDQGQGTADAGPGPQGMSEPLPTQAEPDLAVIIYTSGTTGRPKGAMLSHGNLLHNVESCRLVLHTIASDRFAVLLPLFHSYMLTVGLLLPLLVGGSVVLVKSLHPVRNVLQEILQRQATVLPAIPQFYRSMVNAPVPVPLPLRLCISGAAPLPAQVLKEFEAKFHIPLIEGYGLSEASPVVTKNPLDGTRKAGSIGPPLPNVQVSIQDDSGRELGPNQIGELCVRGGNVMLGYWKLPTETAKVMRHGWLLTGDIGYHDEDGYFFITDRKKDMLLVNGINVYPREIEEVLYQFPGVKEAAVIGKPDSRKGEQPIAFVAPGDGATLEEKAIQHFLRRKLADYKVPRKVVFLPALPRNATGKILKTALRDLNLPT
ncbi:MAG TPA: long-chain fatty acid--CoA ligase [Candidatus Paceibacterota bacterium]|nr:long-chain fatty acid--CoA ligase [Verrucomicrobiota bacterium]HSA12811.1 long-chain fatty acid--CoA ligase [Candidatus Paceibacterota bacterium]